jgi:ADP-heptose:LPS heptosyltransferase
MTGASQIKRVLVYRLGSLGDTLLALPSFHLIRRSFPQALVILLTHVPTDGKAAPIVDVLTHTDLFQGVIRYPLGMRSLKSFHRLWREIRSSRIDLAIHLAESRGPSKSLRDSCFFRICGIRRIIGVPWGQRAARQLPGGQAYEWEAQRLIDRLALLGTPDLEEESWWDLRLTESEARAARNLVSTIPRPFICVSLGTKVDSKDWGVANWKALVKEIETCWPDLGLVLLGSADEWQKSELASAGWRGTRVNLCGKTHPRVSAGVLKNAALFIGHDSGPMHLAATVGTPCVAIFSARSLPGQWYPRGRGHAILYHKTDCFGCGLDRCEVRGKECILSIGVDEVLAAVRVRLEQVAPLHQLRPSEHQALNAIR